LTDGEEETVLCLVNVSEDAQTIEFDCVAQDLPPVSAWQDLIGEGVYPVEGGRLILTLERYQSLWLRGE
jgi:hypothetical protein